jgi:alpha-mannosidase
MRRGYSSQAFTFVTRKRGVTKKGLNFSEPEPYEKNTSGIVCVKDEKEAGLSFVSKVGIHECAVSKNGVISATMLRCFGRIMFGNILNDGAQLEGKLTYKYAITTETDFVKLYDLKKQMSQLYSNVRKAADAKSQSLVEISDDVCISTIKPSEDEKGIVLRLFNPCSDDRNCDIIVKTKIEKAFVTNLAEDERREIEMKDGKIHLCISANKIVTIYLEA